MASGAPFEADEVELLATLWNAGYSNREVYNAYDAKYPGRRSFDAIKKAKNQNKPIVKRLEELKPKPNARPDPEDVARHLTGEAVPGVTDERPTVTPQYQGTHYNVDKLWERRKEETSRHIEYHSQRHNAAISFQTNKPIGLTFISDQHISEGGPVDLARMEADAKLVRDTPGLYAVLGGDGIDNHIKHRTAIIASGSKPGNEWLLFDHYLSLFGDFKVAAMISGNHDDWTKDFTDVDVVGSLAHKRRIFYAPDYVLLDVELPGAVYKVKVRHQYRYNSTINETHSVKRMWEMDGDDFDIGVVCHKHVAALEPFDKHGQVRWAMRPGSYQYISGFSRRYGYGHGLPTCPTMILLPGGNMMHGFRDVRWAASYLRWLRDGWPDTGKDLAA